MEKELEDWQIADAARLKRLFEEKADKSQQAFGLEHEIGTQGMVWQYLNARRALNLDALLKFAYGLKVPVEQISPTLSKKINVALQGANQGAVALSTAGPDTPEGQVLHAMQSMDAQTKYRLIQITQALTTSPPVETPAEPPPAEPRDIPNSSRIQTLGAPKVQISKRREKQEQRRERNE
jgi:hypothetical protein